jgi:hypothetical protein
MDPLVVNGLGWWQGSLDGVRSQRFDSQIRGNINRTVGQKWLTKGDQMALLKFGGRGYCGNPNFWSPEYKGAYLYHYNPDPKYHLPSIQEMREKSAVLKMPIVKTQSSKNSNSGCNWLLIILSVILFKVLL